MMRSEFIERTGFEPMADEYEIIEQEYMGCDVDKDKFCKEWKKNGGIQRLCRMRARRIEELEAEVNRRARAYIELNETSTKQKEAIEKMYESEIKTLEQEISILKQTQDDVVEKMREEKLRADEAERKLAVIKEAFSIITGKE